MPILYRGLGRQKGLFAHFPNLYGFYCLYLKVVEAWNRHEKMKLDYLLRRGVALLQLETFMQPCCLPNISTPDSLHPAPPYFSALLFCLFLGISLDPQWGELSEKDRMCQNIPFAHCTSCFSESLPELALVLNEGKLYKKDKNVL